MNRAARSPDPVLIRYWRYALLLLIVFGTFGALLFRSPVPQDPAYHPFADQRSVFGIPNFFDVASNLGFLIIGIAAIPTCLSNRLGPAKKAWIVLFAGIAFVSAGSGYYHLEPNNETLVWDRLAMTIGFMGLFVAVLSEYIDERLRSLLVPAALLGLASVLYWDAFDDLRFYIWVQAIPLITVPLIMLLFRPRYSHQWLLLAAVGLYVAAKLAEIADAAIFGATRGMISGHSLKHLIAAAACGAILMMVRIREPLARN